MESSMKTSLCVMIWSRMPADTNGHFHVIDETRKEEKTLMLFLNQNLYIS